MKLGPVVGGVREGWVAYQVNEARLHEYFDTTIGSLLRHRPHRASFATYAMGILGDGNAMSSDPIAARACGRAPRPVDNVHNHLLHFLR
jgi:hypothetical protein